MEGIALRKYLLDDASDLALLADNPRIASFVRDNMPQPYTVEDAHNWIRFNLGSGDGPDTINRVIALDGRLIGAIGIRRDDDIHRFNAEIGYWVGEPYWSRGVATGAVKLMADWVFRFTDVHRLYAGVMRPNQASARVLEKARFVLESTIRDGIFKNGVFLDELIFSRYRDEIGS